MRKLVIDLCVTFFHPPPPSRKGKRIETVSLVALKKDEGALQAASIIYLEKRKKRKKKKSSGVFPPPASVFVFVAHAHKTAQTREDHCDQDQAFIKVIVNYPE